MRRPTVLLTATVLAWCLLGCQPPPPPVGIVTSPAEIAALPVEGAAWTAVERAARTGWGAPNLGDNNSSHDTSVLAGAIVAVRSDDDTLTGKVRAAIDQVMICDCYARALEAARNVTSYVLAADLVGLPAPQDTRWRAFLADLRTKPLQGHSGAENIRQTALRSPSNWGAMARAAIVAIDLYLGDLTDLAAVADTHRAWLGEQVPNQLAYTATDWHTGPSGVNPRGATIAGRNVDGVLPEDQRRTGEFTWPAPRGTYPWEALQGAVLTGVMLDRAGIVPFNAGDHALVRAATWLTDVNDNPATGDDLSTPWMLARFGGADLPMTAPTRPGKSFGFADYLYLEMP